MIEMLVCGLMAWYHVDCIQFYFYDGRNEYPIPYTPYYFLAWSDSEAGIGIIHIYDSDPKVRDACHLSALEHELQRFHQNRWDMKFCNSYTP